VQVCGKILESLGRYIVLVLKVFGIIFTNPPPWALVREQMYSIAVMSLPVVAVTGFSTGMVLSAQSFFQLADKGLTGATGLMVAKAMFTEMGPILTAFMVTGRVGSAMCAELGTMNVTEQIDALRSMAVNPLRYLIAPRFIAGITALPLLTVFSNLMGLFGGFIVAVFFFKMQPNRFYDPIADHISHFDFSVGLFKALFFGILIITISCYKGMRVKGGAAGVGEATTKSVVISYSCILISNFILTLAMNLVYQYMYRTVI
jgi:phospholipid/cholesterol/gamma-HCH transport system permease protein